MEQARRDGRLRSAFCAIANWIEEGRRDEALRALEDLSRPLAMDGTEDQLVASIAAALRKRAAGLSAEAGNLYLRDDGLPHMRLFTLLREQVPMIFMTYPIANELLLPHLSFQEQAVIFDIGIGNGEQIADLVAMLGVLGEAPLRLTVVGLDLNAAALEQARKRLLAEAQRWGIALAFLPLNAMIETLGDEDWAMLDRLEGVRVANATFALHHIRQSGEVPDARDRLFQRLRRWRLQALVITETDADLNVVPLRERIWNCYHYFGGVFRHIDALDIDTEEKNLLKLGMLGREIEDILGPNEQGRCERYESACRWRARLEQAGFVLTAPPSGLIAGSNTVITISVDRGYVTLGGADASLVVILCAQPYAV